MNSEISFENHIRYFSSHFRQKYSMTVAGSGRPNGGVSLQNDDVQIRFYPGDVRDAFVQGFMSYSDASLLGPKRQSFELREYVEYCGAREHFPNRYPPDGSTFRSTTHLGLNRDYCFVGSPFLVQELIGFLMVHGDPVVRPDRKQIRDFISWMDEQAREYNERVSRKPSE